VGVAVLVIAAISAAYADRLGAPALLAFLALGMLLGEDGPGGIRFSDAALVRDAGSVAVAVILFEGGLMADRRVLARARGPALMLASLGVLVTAVVVAGATRLAVGVSWASALMVGAVVSPTDAAAVLAATRGIHLRERVAAILEGESGLNDPLAALLVIGLVGWHDRPSFGALDVLRLLVVQATAGLAAGMLAGIAAIWLLRRLPLASAGLAPVVTLSLGLAGYTASAAVGGSGLLAAFVAGIVVGDARVPHAATIRSFLQGLAWLAQIGLFVVLGLLVTPSRVLDAGLTALVVALALVLVARPLAVVASLAPFRVPVREQGFVAWAGLRGGVPIVFATFPVAAGVTGSARVFDIVFFVVVVSVAVQGLTLRRAAAALAVTEPTPRFRTADLQGADLDAAGAGLVETTAEELGILSPLRLRSIGLPAGAVVAAIERDGRAVIPRGSTVVVPTDRLYLLLERDRVDELAGDRAVTPTPPSG
jgi:cell volume regulation protein A